MHVLFPSIQTFPNIIWSLVKLMRRSIGNNGKLLNSIMSFALRRTLWIFFRITFDYRQQLFSSWITDGNGFWTFSRIGSFVDNVFWCWTTALRWAYPSLRSFGVVHWVPEQLNIMAVTGACKLIDGCSLELCSATPSVASSGICHRNKVNSIACLYRDGLAMR